MITIPLSKQGKHAGKYEAIVDDCDADLAELRWNCMIRSHTIYARRSILIPDQGQISVLLHSIVLSRILARPLREGELTDHIDGDGLNNIRPNLRVATFTQNAINRKTVHNKTDLKGVVKRGKKYGAHIRINGRQEWLGLYGTPEQAHAAYCEAAKEHFGEFANEG